MYVHLVNHCNHLQSATMLGFGLKPAIFWTTIFSISRCRHISVESPWGPGGNCIKIGLPGQSILGDYFQENITSPRPFLLLRISFPGRPIFIQFIPGAPAAVGHGADAAAPGGDAGGSENDI